MAALTAAEVSNLGAASLDFYVRGDAFSSAIQEKPFLRKLMSKQRTFPGGKGNIQEQVKGVYTTAVEGYEATDAVSYGNPTNIANATFSFSELHAGISMTFSELKKGGIHVVDSTTGKTTSHTANAAAVILTDILTDKLEDMGEGWAQSFNAMLWKDGSQAAKEVPGVRSLVTDTVATGTVGGIDRATSSWWRNRSSLAIVDSPTTQLLTTTLKSEVRQLRRYGGKPDIILCGSDFLADLEAEVAEKSSYTDTNAKGIDISSQVMSVKGLGTFEYDPTLDDLSLSKYCFFLDSRDIRLRPMEGEDRVQHNPARPFDQYTLYRAMTWTGGLTARRLNSCGVYSVN